MEKWTRRKRVEEKCEKRKKKKKKNVIRLYTYLILMIISVERQAFQLC